jgi:hypothetical protein
MVGAVEIIGEVEGYFECCNSGGDDKYFDCDILGYMHECWNILGSIDSGNKLELRIYYITEIILYIYP